MESNGGLAKNVPHLCRLTRLQTSLAGAAYNIIIVKHKEVPFQQECVTLIRQEIHAILVCI